MPGDDRLTSCSSCRWRRRRISQRERLATRCSVGECRRRNKVDRRIEVATSLGGQSFHNSAITFPLLGGVMPSHQVLHRAPLRSVSATCATLETAAATRGNTANSQSAQGRSTITRRLNRGSRGRLQTPVTQHSQGGGTGSNPVGTAI